MHRTSGDAVAASGMPDQTRARFSISCGFRRNDVVLSIAEVACWTLFVTPGGAISCINGSIQPIDLDMKAPALYQFAWLFTRGEESVRLQIVEQGPGFRLAVNGPGLAQANHDFDSMSSLMIFVHEYEEQLRANDFRLQASAERRAGDRGSRRSGDAERRRH
jgi:hypothetical protein